MNKHFSPSVWLSVHSGTFDVEIIHAEVSHARAGIHAARTRTRTQARNGGGEGDENL